MDTCHESMKMHAGFALDGRSVEKQIHQHCLAAPGVAPDVKTAHRRRFALRTGEPAENARCSSRAVREREPQLLQPEQHLFLTGIPLDMTGGNIVCILIEKSHRHPGPRTKAWRSAARRVGHFDALAHAGRPAVFCLNYAGKRKLGAPREPRDRIGTYATSALIHGAAVYQN